MKINSQTYARIFAVIGTLLLIPGLFGLLVSLLAMQLFFILLPFVIVGCILLRGYFKHKNNNLDEKWIVRLWLGTIIFNGFLFLLTFGYTFSQISYGNELHENESQIYSILVSLGYFALTSMGIFAFSAAKAESRKGKTNQLLQLKH